MSLVEAGRTGLDNDIFSEICYSSNNKETIR